MWLASYVVNLRKIHRRAGADLNVLPILLGRRPSPATTLQRYAIAGTASRKPYLFNAEMARLAPPSWHVRGQRD